MKRLHATREFRINYACEDFHQQGMAAKLFKHDSNPYAQMYFADSGLKDVNGNGYIMGKLSLCEVQLLTHQPL